jgi:nucleotide-binding universal stress UspA family protein
VVKQSTSLTPEALAWRRILVATSGAVWSEAAVEYALRLAQDSPSTVYLLHVEQTRPPRGTDADLASRHPILAPLATRFAEAGIPACTRLAHGEVVRAILDTATAETCDLIILGSRGLTGWKRLMLGSTSNAVAAKAGQPVLLVKHFVEG